MKNRILLFGCAVFALTLVACSGDGKDDDAPQYVDATGDVPNGEDDAEGDTTDGANGDA